LAANPPRLGRITGAEVEARNDIGERETSKERLDTVGRWGDICHELGLWACKAREEERLVLYS